MISKSTTVPSLTTQGDATAHDQPMRLVQQQRQGISGEAHLTEGAIPDDDQSGSALRLIETAHR
jgi:hypothetical protein